MCLFCSLPRVARRFIRDVSNVVKRSKPSDPTERGGGGGGPTSPTPESGGKNLAALHVELPAVPR